MIYKAHEIKNWVVSASTVDGYWIPARPMSVASVQALICRCKAAWYVLIGRYDALDWQEEKHG